MIKPIKIKQMHNIVFKGKFRNLYKEFTFHLAYKKMISMGAFPCSKGQEPLDKQAV